MDTLLLNFQKYLHDLAPTDAERAEIFGVCRETIVDWRHGRSLRSIVILTKHPGAFRALAADAEARREANVATEESAAA